MKYTYIIIDDEERCINVLKQYSAQFGQLTEIKTYSNPLLALKEISEMEGMVDLIFMDVEMPEMGGVELSKKIRNKTHKLIFTTAYSKYAFDAYELRVEAYLLKPFSYTKFADEISRVFPLPGTEESNENDYILVKNTEENNTVVRMDFKDIFAFESFGNYVKVHSSVMSTPVKIYLTLKGALEILHQKKVHQYIQVHRSFIISTEHIQGIKGKIISMPNGMKVSSGDYYRANFKAMLDSELIIMIRK